MRQTYEDFLFARGYLVSTKEFAPAPESAAPAAALVALAHFAEIRITSHPELADLHMLKVAAHNLGCSVPEPFYRGFPESVRKLSSSEKLYDQLISYFITYDLGDFSEPRHSLFEEDYERAAFAEDVEPKLFAIITEEEAEEILARAVDGFLASTRPLNDTSYDVLKLYLFEHAFRVGDHPLLSCACKDTACRLLLDLRQPALSYLLVLPDVIRLVEWMLELGYPDMTINKLNLKNKDRKFLSAILDRFFERGEGDLAACLEKKRAWNGLLHHLHYRPKNACALAFCYAIRGKEERSAYSDFEQRVVAGDVRGAVDSLRASKGSTAVMRKLDYLLSRCESDEDFDYVLGTIESKNKIVLIQLLMHFYSDGNLGPRVFKFVHLNKLRKHIETESEWRHRKSVLSNDAAMKVLFYLEDTLARACKGTLGKVYADEAMQNIAIPLQEAASFGGYGTLPRGSRIPIPAGKKIRAFVYWEKVDDIDLSCFAIRDDGSTREFSWRSMAWSNSDGIVFSGDVTSGYKGGSEYFDIDIPKFLEHYPSHYLIFAANVFTEVGSFAQCECRAGYMVRDEEDSGEIYEPKTVKSAFTVNCASKEAYLFGIDLRNRAFVWLNIAEQSLERVAGEGDMNFLIPCMHTTEAINLYDFARMLATEIVDTPEEADVVFSDENLELREGQEQIRSFDTERLVELLNS